METVQWDTFNEDGTIRTSKDHFMNDGDNKTLCGIKLPYETATDIYGTGYSKVTCKSCNKIAKSQKNDKEQAETVKEKTIIFEESDSDTVCVSVKCGTIFSHKTIIPRGKEKTFINTIREYCTVPDSNIISYGVIF